MHYCPKDVAVWPTKDAFRSSTSRTFYSSTVVGLIMPRSGFEDTSYEHTSQVKSGVDNQ